MTSSVVQNAAILSTLPPEILAVISVHCLPPGQPLPSSREAPLLVAQICHQWREICLDTPDLWELVTFGEKSSLELLQTWLSRAKGRPLSLTLQCVDPRRAGILMDIIIPCIPQWKHVTFTLPVAPLRRLHLCNFPTLERLVIASSGRVPVSDDTEYTILGDAPRLSQVDIHALPQLKFGRRLERLTSLRFSIFDNATHAITTLRMCPNLVDLFCSFGSGAPLALPPVELNSLRSLAVTTEIMLPCVTVPLLKRLQISRLSRDIDAASALRSLVSRSSCEIQSLSVDPRHLNNEQFGSFLRAVNFARHLKLTLSAAVRFPQQIEVLGEADVLPRLTHLEICDVAGSRVQFRALLDLLSWRQQHTALEKFELWLGTRRLGPGPPRILPPAVMDEFRALGEAGMRLRIRTRERLVTGSVDVVHLDTF
ncbi:hypothetical protein B0H16DRAFT_1487709 [Mycena metata]|uniref:F-box domain-containing protein n=1 Tax=Mycena metata TaxID=1033252 RepID=A0AAD7KH65_9AGAR|nr:hypothetical protein B0H16DRAFT_1487709 [Mycena metata]